MDFVTFKKRFQENFQKISQYSSPFEVELDKDVLWNLYLDSFPAGTNELFRERREFDCSCCRSFIKSIGNVVFLKDLRLVSVWDFETGETDDLKFQPVIDALSHFVKSHAISNAYVSKLKKIGTNKNYEDDNGHVIEWDHFYLELPNNFVDSSSKSEAEIKGELRDTHNVFKRSLDEISEESVLTILELISQNSLYKGEEWKGVLNEFLQHKRAYEKLQNSEKEHYAWEKATVVGPVIGRIRNHSMGTLLTNLSEGMDLDLAVHKYESIVAGVNFKRSKPIHTAKMLKDAMKTVQELGYMDSLERRHATLDDITVNNILFVDRDVAKRIGGTTNVFDEMLSELSLDPKKFSKVEEISIENFIKNILPSANKVEVLLENKHASNMVSLIAPKIIDSKSMFKWKNNFSWAYTGNITDSYMKELVKSAGGNVNGVLRFSIQWNDKDHDQNDLDAHCIEPSGFEIMYSRKDHPKTTGSLDVDIIHPTRSAPAVENITWTNREKMEEGTYQFLVHNFTNRGGKTGFRAEIEFDGQIFSFDYNKEVRQSQKILVAEITFSRTRGFSIQEKLPSSVSSREIWGLTSNQFVPVSVAMYSPNFWDEQHGTGHRHYFFMLKNCVNPERPNGFYNEFLSEKLMKHRRVFEALGSKMAVEETDDQLSGLGFSATKRNELVVKVTGQTQRVLKVKF